MYTNNENSISNADRNIPDKFARLKAMVSGEMDKPTLASDIRFWAHEPNQPLMGTILGFDTFEHPSYGRQETVIVERDNGEVVSAILTNYLQNGMQLQHGCVGDLVFIEKLGQERSKNGKTFNKFQMLIDKQ
jgi:hypothetical protein